MRNPSRAMLAAIVFVAGFFPAFFVERHHVPGAHAAVLEITRRLRRNPISYLVAVTMAANIGSVASPGEVRSPAGETACPTYVPGCSRPHGVCSSRLHSIFSSSCIFMTGTIAMTGKIAGYSTLNAAPGSTRAARRAGSHTDSTVMTDSSPPAAASDSGSMGERR